MLCQNYKKKSYVDKFFLKKIKNACFHVKTALKYSKTAKYENIDIFLREVVFFAIYVVKKIFSPATIFLIRYL